MKLKRGATETLPLTPRQLDVLRLLCRGMPNHAIATKLGISLSRIEKHRSEIMIRTGCRKEIQLGMWVQRNRCAAEIDSRNTAGSNTLTSGRKTRLTRIACAQCVAQ